MPLRYLPGKRKDRQAGRAKYSDVLKTGRRNAKTRADECAETFRLKAPPTEPVIDNDLRYRSGSSEVIFCRAIQMLKRDEDDRKRLPISFPDGDIRIPSMGKDPEECKTQN